MKTILFVESPLQLLNAYEATMEFGLKNYKVFIRFSNNYENDKQMKFLIKYLNIKNIKLLTINADKKNIIDYIKLLIYRCKFISKKRRISKVFIGNYTSSFFKLIIKQFDQKQIILLDDGSKTLHIQRQFSEYYFYNMFTIYEFEQIKKQIIYKNEYKNLSKKLHELEISYSEILFLGMKLSEIGIMDEKYYIKQLKKISDIYIDKKIIYIAHRGESKTKLEKIRNIKNIEVKQYSYPIELLGIFELNIPFKVISFYSTALLTMKYIYKLEAEYILFDYSSSEHKNAIKYVYDYYSKIMKGIDPYD